MQVYANYVYLKGHNNNTIGYPVTGSTVLTKSIEGGDNLLQLTTWLINTCVWRKSYAE
jgi:hypothetical protein